MENEFNKFFRDNREALDTEQPNANFLWKGVEADLAHTKYRRKITWWRAVAVILAFVALGQGILQFIGASYRTNEKQDAITMENNGFQNLADAYETDIQNLENRVKQKNINHAEYTTLYEQLAYIDAMKEDVNANIPLTNDKERLAEMLADTYEKKILLLERLLQQIEREENAKRAFKEL